MSATIHHPPGARLWRARDLLRLLVMLSGSAVMLLVSWWGMTSTVKQSEQMVWLNVGVLGVLVCGAGAVLWLGAGRRSVGQRRLRLAPDVTPRVKPGTGARRRDHDVLVSGARMTRYHRATCPLLAGKDTEPAPEPAHRAAGRAPCGVCRPDSEAVPLGS